VHQLVCEFIAAQAEAGSSCWTKYSAVFLSAAVQDLIRSRLPRGRAGSPPPTESAGDGGGGGPKKKKRKLDADLAAVADDVSWTVCCCDGATFSVAVPEDTRVAEVKRAIGSARWPHFAMELFVKGEEEPLDDERRLISAEKVPLFMLPKKVSDRLALEALAAIQCAGWPHPCGAGPVWSAAGAVPERNQLTGPIAAELGQLGALINLHLHENELSGPIPVELAQAGAGSLGELYLQGNQLSGQEAFRECMEEHNAECDLEL
jgi:hypothetical protein